MKNKNIFPHPATCKKVLKKTKKLDTSEAEMWTNTESPLETIQRVVLEHEERRNDD